VVFRKNLRGAKPASNGNNGEKNAEGGQFPPLYFFKPERQINGAGLVLSSESTVFCGIILIHHVAILSVESGKFRESLP